jgi:hypothetical protein
LYAIFHMLELGKRGFRYSLALAEGSLVASLLCVFAGGLAATFQARPLDVSGPLAVQVIEAVALIALSIGPSAYWVFRRVARRGTRQEAGLVARTFAVVAPVGMCIGTPLAWGVGAAIDAVLMVKWPWAHLVGLGIGIVGTISVAMTVATIAATAVVMRIVRRSRDLPPEREDVS